MSNSKSNNFDLPQGLQIGILDDVNLLLLVEHRRETNRLDYKITFSTSNKKACHEFCKDASAFANIGGGYLVIGVEPYTYKVIGITKHVEKDIDPTKISQTLSKYISPSIELNTYVGNYKEDSKEFRIGLIYIPEFKRRPYFINGTFSYEDKKKNKEIISLHEGTIYVRRQSASKHIDADSWEELLERYYDKVRKTRNDDFGKKISEELFELDRKTFFKKGHEWLKK